MYWIYNVFIIFCGLAVRLFYTDLPFEDGFYGRIKQIAGYIPSLSIKEN